MKTRKFSVVEPLLWLAAFTLFVLTLLLSHPAFASAKRRIGQATGTTSQTVTTGGAEWISVQCGKTGYTKVTYRFGNSANAPTAVTTDQALDFSSDISAYRLHVPVPVYDRIAFIALDGASSFTCDVYEEYP